MHKKYNEFLVRSVLHPFRFFPPIRCPSPKVLQTLRKANLLRKYFTSYLDISRLPTRGCTWYECTTYPSSFPGSGQQAALICMEDIVTISLLEQS